MDEKKQMNRRDFLKIVGISTVGATAALSGCAPDKKETSQGVGEVPVGKMTYRQFPPNEDKVSLLGYGCMRWPTLPAPGGDGNVIDQEEVNRLVDYAIEHGVNYFDTAPVYVQGWSETSTGIALKRHPREKFFVATKMSNFSNSDYDFGVKMYHNSMKKLQVDYIDYYLLHMLGAPGKRGLQGRFLDNGLLDFLLKEREAGRIRHLGWSFHGKKEEFDRALAMHDQVHWDFIQIQLNYSDWLHASGNNVNADYLYEQVSSRNIPVVVMEPLLGGRLSNIPEHVFTRLKERNPEGSVASWAFRFAGTPDKVLTVLSGMTYLEHLQDNIRTYSPLEELTEAEYALLEENAVEFASLGFDIDFAGEGTIEVKGTPADMPADAVDQMVYDLLQAFSTPVSLADQRREKIAAVMARGGAKGIPRNMSRDEAAVLLAQLAATGNFSFSPSGKAITAEITPEDIRTKLG